jgi:predicted transglutaminase-like cysteine proteinase
MSQCPCQTVSDMEHWGVIDQWDYPSDGKGDCEDFALFKRRKAFRVRRF